MFVNIPLGLYNWKQINFQCFTCSWSKTGAPTPPFCPDVLTVRRTVLMKDSPDEGVCQVAPPNSVFVLLPAASGLLNHNRGSIQRVCRSWLNITQATGLAVTCAQTQWREFQRRRSGAGGAITREKEREILHLQRTLEAEQPRCHVHTQIVRHKYTFSLGWWQPLEVISQFTSGSILPQENVI